MKLDICNLKSDLIENVKINFKAFPFGWYNMHGKVERKTQVNKSIENTMNTTEQLLLIWWETCISKRSQQNQ